VTPAVNPPPYSNEIILKTVMFQNLEGRTMTLKDIPIAWKIQQLREKLGREKALDVDDLRLLWGGKQLEDGMRNMPETNIHCPLSADDLPRKHLGGLWTRQGTFSGMILSFLGPDPKFNQDCTIHIVSRLRGGYLDV
jgi:hypothetical protein